MDATPPNNSLNGMENDSSSLPPSRRQKPSALSPGGGTRPRGDTAEFPAARRPGGFPHRAPLLPHSALSLSLHNLQERILPGAR